MANRYNFPSQRKNWSAPRGFKSYIPHDRKLWKKIMDLADREAGISEKKQVDWGWFDAFCLIAFVAILGTGVWALGLLLEMFLISHGI